MPNSVFNGVHPILHIFLHHFKLATHGGVSCYSHAAWWRCVQFVRHTSGFLLVVQMKPLVLVLMRDTWVTWDLFFLGSEKFITITVEGSVHWVASLASQHLTVLTLPLLVQLHLLSSWSLGTTQEAREQEVHVPWISQIMINVFDSFFPALEQDPSCMGEDMWRWDYC